MNSEDIFIPKPDYNATDPISVNTFYNTCISLQ